MEELFRIGILVISTIFTIIFIITIVDLAQYLRKSKERNG